MNKLSKRSLLIGLFFLAIVLRDAFLYQDVAKYRTLEENANALIEKNKIDRQNKFSEDMQLFAKCQPIEGVAVDKAVIRACLIDTAPLVKTDAGAVSIASRMLVWIIDNGDDEAIRNAGLSAISAGRANISFRQKEHEELSLLLLEYEQSIAAKFIFPRPSDPENLNQIRETLDQLESAISQPKLFAKGFNRG